MSENTNEQPAPGTIGWVEIFTPDQQATIDFYTKTCGWQTSEMPMGDETYTMFEVNGKPIAGIQLLEGPAAEAPPMWLSYVQTEDLDASIAAIENNGGTIRRPRTDIPMGSFAVVADPHGATFAFWQPNPEAS